MEKVVVAGHGGTISVTADKSVVYKLAGSDNALSVIVKSAADAPLSGLCFILSGNQTKLDVTVESEVQKLYFSGSGNMSQGAIHVTKGGAISQGLVVRMSGNNSSLVLDGEGAFSCPTPDLRGRGSKVECVR